MHVNPKHLGFFLGVVVGIFMVMQALHMLDRSSFDDGSFLWAILMGLGGAGAVVLGLGMAIFVS